MSNFPIKKEYLQSLVIVCAILLLFVDSCIADNFDLKGIIKSHIKKNFPWAEVEIIELTAKGEVDALPEKILFHQPPPGKTILSIELINGKKIHATALIKAYDWVVVSSKSMRKGDHLELTDVYLTLMDVTKIPRGAINRIDSIIGKQLSRPVNANSPILDTLLHEQRFVKKGQMVLLVFESPHFTIRTTGEIKSNTYIGSKAKVMNLASKKVISGVLIDENTVKVEF